MKPEKLMIIDGNSILNRAFYGLHGEQLLATSGGLHTNAVYGFLTILNKFLEEEKPEYLCVAFDLKAPTFRHAEFTGYKAKRRGMPEELAEQVPVMKEVLDAMNIRRLELEGYEADDIIGSISLCAEQRNMEVVIITGDRDSLQLAGASTRIKMPVTRAGRTETEEYDADRVMERYGVTPLQFIDVKGLMGDQSDNIPGVPGIGEKTALDLIIRFGSLENLYENLQQLEKKAVREKLEANRELAFLSRRIATIERNMPFLCSIEELKRCEFDSARLYELFKKLEFKTLIEKFNLARPVSQAAAVPACKLIMIQGLDALRQVGDTIRAAGHASVFFLAEKLGSYGAKPAGVAFSWGGECNAYVDLVNGISEKQFLEEFRDILEDCGIKKTGHDLKSLMVYLRWNGIILRGAAFDTMIGAYIINPSADSYAISGLSDAYLGIRAEDTAELTGKGKNFTPLKNIPVERLAVAAVNQCVVLSGLAELFDRMLRENGQERLYYEIELPLAEVLADMEYRGFKVDIGRLRQFSSELDDRISMMAEMIYRLAGEQFNINSPKQLGVILFERLGLPVIKKTKTGYSTDAEVLEQLAPMHEAVSGILEYRQLVKLKTTYAEGLLSLVNPDTGRIHSSFNQSVTATGRISSTEPNLQNIPIKLEMGREIRKVFVPEDERYLLSDADYSQIELRVLAHITGDENMTKAFRNNEDIHTATASGVFRVPREEVTSIMRSRAKAVNFGIVYGIGDFSLARDLGITRKEARKYIDDYLERYPGVKKYMHDTVEKGKKYGYVTTMFDRRRYLPELKSSNFNIRSFGERVAMNAPIQGSAADIIKIAMVKVYKRLQEHSMKSRLILQVHDELLIETCKTEKEQVEALLRECMESAACMRVPLVAEVKSGSSWYETK
jgi:DNA polymerase-1